MLSLSNKLSLSTKVPSFTNNYSLEFDGTNDYVNIDAINNDISNSRGSVSTWIKIDTVSVSVTVVKFLIDNSNFIRIWYNGSTNKLAFQTKADETSSLILADPEIENDENWHHIAMTWDKSANEIIGYLDGSQFSITATYGGTLSNDAFTESLIGSNAGTTSFWLGHIDEMCVYDTVLSGADVTSVYNSGVPTDLLKGSSYDTDRTSNIIAYYRMERGSGTTLYDTAGDNLNGTLINSPTWSTDIP